VSSLPLFRSRSLDRYDDVVVGAGIIGLAHAYHLARRGRRVVVVERSLHAHGASIRNFGMLWPVGQPAGEMRNIALRSRALWLDVLSKSGIWHDPCGSLHLAYDADEEAVLREFVAEARTSGIDCAFETAEQIAIRAPAVRQQGLRGAMWSETEICVDPREVVRSLPEWLHTTLDIDFIFGEPVTGYSSPIVQTSIRAIKTDRLWVCSGDEFQLLYPDAIQQLGLTRCKLQMMRTVPQKDGWRIGPMLAAGSTLRHYKSFENCPSLPLVKERFAREYPLFDAYGIHVMTAQNGSGEVVIGDSHEYGTHISPFDSELIDGLILEYLATFVDIRAPKIAQRWHGVYAKHPDKPYVFVHPEPDVTVITGVGGAGMTLSFGLAEKIVSNVLDVEQDSA